MSLSAHLWTVWPLLRGTARAEAAPTAEDWEVRIEDPDIGSVRLTGHWRSPASARQAVILVHGLGGCAESRYLPAVVRAADELGLASLRLNLRGADRGGGDLAHAGLSSDLAAVLAGPRLAAMESLYLLGFSLGGHLVLKFATEVDDERLRAVAAVCSPLDLERTVNAFDRPARWPYRRYVLAGLFDIYDAVARNRDVPVAPEEVRRVKTLRDFDRLVVVPRFGFDDPEDYYRRASVGPRLAELRVPALLVAVTGDPMVDKAGIVSALDGVVTRPGMPLEVCWTDRGGHVSFPGNLDLGLDPDRTPGIEHQVLHWLLSGVAT